MKTRPPACRDSEVRSFREIAARAAFLAYVLSAPAGAFLLLWGGARGQWAAAGAGAAGLLLFLSLHGFARHRLNFAQLRSELRCNPFRRAAAGADPQQPSSGGADTCRGACSIL
jgi:hypothetical protein